MAEDPFAKTEDEFFRLKGQRAAGRITQSQFEAALRDLMVQDAQGRYWMLGVDSAKWYMHDGKSWVEARPPSGSVSTISEATLPPASLPSTTGTQNTRRLRVIAIGLAALILICVAIGIGLYFVSRQGSPLVTLNRTATPTFVLPPPTLFSPSGPLATNSPTLVSTPTTIATATALATSTRAPTPTNTLLPSPTPRPEANCSDPGAQWENVVDGQRIDPIAAMQGTANVADFDEYVIEYLRPGNVLYRSRTPVVHNVLFVWNTNTVANGDYLLALIVFLRDGSNLAPCVIRVRVQH